MTQARPEPADDRLTIRNQMDDYFDKLTTNNYSLLNIQDSNSFLNEAGATVTASLPDPDPTLTGALTASLTGARSPGLPMTISLSDKDNNRILFTMLINPANMNHGKTHSTYATYTRQGFVTQLWGPNQDLLTSTGTTSAFMVEGIGLTSTSRRRSFGLQNFMALLYAYRNNGYEFLDKSDIKTAFTRVINTIHGVELSYDGQLFMGHFNNFTIDENAEKPFVFDYNFEFVISSLSNNYNEVRGHFAKIPIQSTSSNPVLLSQI